MPLFFQKTGGIEGQSLVEYIKITKKATELQGYKLKEAREEIQDTKKEIKKMRQITQAALAVGK